MKLYLYFTLVFIINGVFAQYQGPIPALTSGYGSMGSNAVSVSNITNDHFNQVYSHLLMVVCLLWFSNVDILLKYVSI